MQWGGAYAFDEQAYAVFRPLARRAGAELGPERFSSPIRPAKNWGRQTLIGQRHFRRLTRSKPHGNNRFGPRRPWSVEPMIVH